MREISLKHPALKVDAAPADTHLLILLPEVHPLGPLPGLNTEEEEDSSDEHNTPLPADSLVLEHRVADDRDVKDREDGDEAGADGEEEELVAPHIDDPLREVLFGAGLHAEEGAAHINHLPGKEEREPGEACKTGGASAEDGVAAGREVVVTVLTEVTVAPGVEDQAEGCETQRGDPDTIDQHIEHDFKGEDTAFQLSEC